MKKLRWSIKYSFKIAHATNLKNYNGKTKIAKMFVLFYFLLFIYISIMTFASPYAILYVNIFDSEYYSNMRNVFYYNSYYEKLDTEYILSDDIKKINNKIYFNPYFNNTRYDLILQIAEKNDEIKQNISAFIAVVLSSEISTKYKKDLQDFHSYAKGFDMSEATTIADLLIDISVIEKQILTIESSIEELIHNYDSNSLSALYDIKSSILLLNAYDRERFDDYSSLFADIEEHINNATSHINSIKLFYKQLTMIDIDEIDSSNLDALYYNLDLLKGLPKNDRYDLQYIEEYIEMVIEKVANKLQIFFIKAVKNS